MAKRGKVVSSGGSCPMCAPSKACAWVVLIIGILLLLRDLGYNYIDGIGPWTFVFVLIGLCMVKCSK